MFDVFGKLVLMVVYRSKFRNRITTQEIISVYSPLQLLARLQIRLFYTPQYAYFPDFYSQNLDPLSGLKESPNSWVLECLRRWFCTVIIFHSTCPPNTSSPLFLNSMHILFPHCFLHLYLYLASWFLYCTSNIISKFRFHNAHFFFLHVDFSNLLPHHNWRCFYQTIGSGHTVSRVILGSSLSKTTLCTDPIS